MKRCSVLLIMISLCGAAAYPDSGDLSALHRTDNGGMLVEFKASYSPQGRKGTAIEINGDCYDYTALLEETILELSGSARLGASSRIGLSLNRTLWDLKEERAYATERRITSSSGQHFGSSLFVSQRLLPNHALDPYLTLTLANPGPSGISISASYILDPVVLVGRLDLLTSSKSETHWLAVAGSIGFVANARLSLVATGSLNVPVDSVGLPSASFGLKAAIAREQQRVHELDVQFLSILVGEIARIRIDLCIRRRFVE